MLYGKKYFRRSRLDGDVDFRQMTRHAYGYNPDVTGMTLTGRISGHSIMT